MLQALCRNCGWIGERDTPPARCPQCGSPRLVAHAELTALSIAHVDCDAFYASIEKRDDPSLGDKPLIVGGGTRGVVSTCCYIARQSGVRSAMPMFTALKLCPDAVVIRPNMAKYVGVSRQIRALMDKLTPLVEPLSIDEAFLDLSGTAALHRASPAEVLAKLARDVESTLGITLSIGLSHNKFLAKTASDLDKPRGFAVIGRAETLGFLVGQPVDLIYGVGKVFAETLRRDGFDTIGQLQQTPPEDLMRRYGETGARLARLSRGEDSRAVSIDGEAKTISAETTFNTDLSDFDGLSTELLALSERLSERVKARNLVGDTVTLKLKSAGFRLRTRARHLMISTQLASVLYETGLQLLAREVDGTAFRLIGIGLSGLGEADGRDPTDLVEPGVARKAAAERAMDLVRTRFGNDAVIRGKLYDRRKPRANEDKIEEGKSR
ncbi:MAG: DNA polymerase IV [Devosia sp. 67-54]|uniref:DNA polymerase IV n=1 Tax=unclassified Devosia TaxID=196773 RepID=UPI000962B75E|nr:MULTISPECIES: DNA polymerase IV [unclassified Devosia]MBN9304241.1 DNA polymerase IV [Devosia sp.]OJX18057.1 MAG: DNA polymerase IV [Devosia sp. 67-54]